MDYYCDVCDKTINFKSKGKHHQSITCRIRKIYTKEILYPKS